MISQGIAFYEFNNKGIITVQENYHEQLVKRKQRAVQSGEWRLIFEPQVRKDVVFKKVQLFHLKEDPMCTNDVSAVYPEICSRLLEELKKHYGDEL